MAEVMTEQGAGSWWVGVLLAGVTVVAGLGGCVTDSAVSDSSMGERAPSQLSTSRLAEVNAEGSMLVGSARGAVERSNSTPEQVVQHMAIAPASARSETPGTARLSATGGPGAALESGSRAPIGEPITPRHLEAELNRLEAELGR
jgi:hypothetical protein